MKIDDNSGFVSGGFEFVPGKTFSVCIYRHYHDFQVSGAIPLATGMLTLGSSIFAESQVLNSFERRPDYHIETEHFIPTGASLERKKRNQHAILKGWKREWSEARARAYEEAELDLAEL